VFDHFDGVRQVEWTRKTEDPDDAELGEVLPVTRDTVEPRYTSIRYRLTVINQGGLRRPCACPSPLECGKNYTNISRILKIYLLKVHFPPFTFLYISTFPSEKKQFI